MISQFQMPSETKNSTMARSAQLLGGV
jgi:hypothetical protein